MTVLGTLDAETRRASLADELARQGALQLQATALQFGVHPMTIRRDFDAFVTSGIARRVRGGVVSIGGDAFSQRKYQHAAAKSEISKKLHTLTSSNTAIALDASTTVHAFAESLTEVSDLSVITNGLSAFNALFGREGVKSYLTGGEREEQNISLVGSLAVHSIRQFALDVCILSTMSLDPEFGTGELTLEQVAVKQAMVDASETVVLALDSSKLDTRARFRSLALSSFDVLVTELDPADTRLDVYRGEISRVL